MLGVFAGVAALCGALAPWGALPLVVAACWGCYEGSVAHVEAPGGSGGLDLRVLALLGAVALLGRVLSGPVERAWGHRGAAARAAVEANPLFRSDDRRRARLRRHQARLLATALGLGLAVGITVHARSAAEAQALRGHGHAVTATTLADAVPARSARATRGGVAPVVSVPAAWEYPAGTRHTGRVMVFRHQAAGTRVTVWVDGAGRLTDAPASASDLIASSALFGLAASVAAALLAVLVCRLLRRRLDLLAARAWAEDWARVEPYWSGRRRNEDVGGGR